MTTSQLQSFLIVCDTLSFTDAGKALGLTSSAVSRQISTLENELAVRLFARKNNSLSLTAAGIRFRTDIEQILSFLDKAANDARNLDRGINGELRLGILFDQNIDDFIFNAIQSISADGKVTVTVKRLSFRSLYQQLESGYIDAAITIIQSKSLFTDFSKYIYATEPICVALHRSLADGIKAPLDTGALFSLSENIPLCSLPLNSFIDSQQPFLKTNHATYSGFTREMDLDSIIPMTLAGLCGAFSNRSSILFRDENIVCLPAPVLPAVDKGVLWRPGSENPVIPKFLELLRASAD